MRPYVIGIDPGLGGAAACVARTGGSWVIDMPTAVYGKTGFVKRAVDLPELTAYLDTVAVNATAVIERVSAFPGQGVGSMFSLGMSYWGVAGVLAGLGIPVRLVEPKAWKAHFGLSKDKAESLALARKLFPDCVLTRQKDHGRAEALLIARYGQEA